MGLTATFSATGATGVTRLVVASGGSDYCAEVASGDFVPWSGFTVECWEQGGASLSAGSPISQVGVQLNAASLSQNITDFCIESIVVNE
jgi:hypothetical protein